jgi:lipopolysaccharide export system permease protein
MGAFINESVSFSAILQYYAYSIPFTFYQVLPIACLVATIFSLGMLQRNNELVAFFSSGFSLSRVIAPILVLVFLISCFGILISDQVLPEFAKKKNYVYYVDIKKQPGLYSTIKTNRIWYRSNNILFNISTLDPETKTAEDITLNYFDKHWHLVQVIKAGRVEFASKQWKLTKGDITVFVSDSSFPLTQNFSTKTISMDEDISEIQKTAQPTDVLGVQELKYFIRKNKESGLDTLRYEMDYHTKFSYPFAALVLSFLSVPFSIAQTRSAGRAMGIGKSLALTFIYWAAYSSFYNIGKHGYVPSVVAAWTPNVILFFVGSVFFLRLKK